MILNVFYIIFKKLNITFVTISVADSPNLEQDFVIHRKKIHFGGAACQKILMPLIMD